MIAALVAVAALLGSQLAGSSAAVLPSGTVWATLALICVFVLGSFVLSVLLRVLAYFEQAEPPTRARLSAGRRTGAAGAEQPAH